MIADIEIQLARTQPLIEEAYALSRSTLQSMQVSSTLKSGSAALEASPAVKILTTANGRRAEAQRHLDSVKTMRNSAQRTGREKGLENPLTLTMVDTFATDARNHLTSDSARALKPGTEANRLTKEALQKAQTER